MNADARAKRRAHAQRVKSKARRVMRQWSGRRQASPDPREIGVNASTHCRPCSCWMCQADRTEIPPPRERSFLHPDLP